MNVPEGRYMSMDPRLIDKFLRCPDFIKTQSLSSVQAMERRLRTRRFSPNERKVHYALEQGYRVSALPLATGLTTQDIQTALDKLESRGEVFLAVSP